MKAPLLKAVLLLSLLLLASASSAQNLEIYCIEVGLNDAPTFIKQGDSTLIIGPDGTSVLIDGGDNGNLGANTVLALFSRLSLSDLDYMITTHWDADHSNGMDDIASYNSNQYRPTTIYDLGDAATEAESGYNTVFGGRMSTPSVGDTIALGDGCTLTFVTVDGNILGGGYRSPGSDPNERSIGVLVQYGGFDYLSCGDLPIAWEDDLSDAIVSAGHEIDLLHVSHHGSYNSTSNAFCYDLEAEYAVISCGDGQTYGHPHQYVINRLNALTDGGSAYTPAYPAVTTIYILEDPGNGTAGNVTTVGTGHDTDPTLQGSLHITVQSDGSGAEFSFANEGPNTNSISDGPYDSDEGGLNIPDLLISEVAVDDNDPNGHDWIEVYLPIGSSSVDMTTVYMTDYDSVYPVADNGTLTMAAGDVLIIHDTTGTSENDSSTKGGNGLWDVYQDSVSWPATDDQFVLTTENAVSPSAASIIDAVCWSNDDGSMTSSEVTDGNTLIGTNNWGDPSAGSGTFTTGNQGPAIGDINDGYAQRNSLTDDNDVNDWTISATHSHGTPLAGGAPTSTPTRTPTTPPGGSMLLNPGFEDGGTPPASWSKYGGTFETSGDRSQAGSYSGKYTDDNTSLSYGYQVVQVTGGAQYDCSGYIYDNASSAEGYFRIDWYASSDGSGTALGTEEIGSRTSNSASWQYRSETVTAHASANSARFKCYINASGSPYGPLYFDGLAVTASGGGATATPTRTHTRTPTRTPTTTQSSLLDEGFEGATFPPSGWAGTVDSADHSTSYAHGGTYSCRFNANGDEIVTPLLANPGTLTYWMRASAGATSFNVQYGSSQSGPWNHLAGSPTTTDYGGNWVQEQFDLSAYSNICIRFSRGTTRYYYLDDVAVTEGLGSGPTHTPTRTPTRTPTTPPGGTMLLNPGFEEGGTPPTSWSKYGGTFETSGDRSQAGSYSGKYTDDNTSLSYGYQVVQVTGGAQYDCSGYIYDNASSAEGYFRIDWYASSDGSGSALGTEEIGSRTSNSASWQYRSETVTAHASANSARFKCYIDASGSPYGPLYYDGLAVAAAGGGATATPTRTPTQTGPTPTPGGIIRINYHPSGAPTPSGYIPDNGGAYGAHGSYTYGWL